MPAITFILRDGRRQTVTTDDHPNAMQAAIYHNIPGIDGACGGFCSCATCHVHVESGGERLPSMTADEDAMLAGTAAKRNKKTSRLACQIALSPAVDGLVLRIPEKQ